MSLATYQKTLLTIFTDELYRTQFFNDTEKKLEVLDLSEKEKNSLRTLPKRDVERFSDGLVRKRIGIGREIISSAPLSSSPVVLFPSHRSGPSLFFKISGGEREQQISYSAYVILKQLLETDKKLSAQTLLDAYIEATPEEIGKPTLRGLFEIELLVSKHKLTGRGIRRLL